ncbi:MAG: MBOAT family protein [Bacteroidia bacterium]|nr:MBOAT family protein [Bacteroidia bacterium]
MNLHFPIHEALYHPDRMFLFTGWFFWFFFAILLLGYSFVFQRPRGRTIYLLLFSFYFYYKTGGPFIFVLWTTILSDFLLGKKLHQSEKPHWRKFYLAWSIILNLSVLGYFKYSEFLVNALNDIGGFHFHYENHFALFSNSLLGTEFRVDKLLVPVGVSFFTFQSMSYVWDIYLRKIMPLKHITDYAFFVSFFPHLVAGPIVKAHEFIHQIYAPYRLDRKEFGLALFWILNGWMKKCMADYFAVQYIDRCFSSPHLFSGVEHVISLFAYSLQVYMDFSGYTDMAIGIARLLGYRLKTNFLSPYKALSTSEFWKRWHISLSSWLQEYLYIPLGGNKNASAGSWIALSVIIFFLIMISGNYYMGIVFFGVLFLVLLGMMWWEGFRKKVYQYLNIMVTMLLGGLWHGSSWMFVIWGGLNGLGILVHKTWQKFNPLGDKISTRFLYRAACLLLTLSFITYTRLFFRSPDMNTVSEIHRQLLSNFHPEILLRWITEYKDVFFWLCVGYGLHWLPSAWKEYYRNRFAQSPYEVQAGVSILMILAGYQFVAGGTHPFIYFQF